MFHFYILYSKTKNRYYIGATSDLQARIIRHNQKNKGFTGNVSDWKLMYKEEYSSSKEMYKREREVKKWKSRKLIEQLINSVGSEHSD